MFIQVSIKYTEHEYLEAVKEKLTVMPNKQAHTFLPFILLLLLTSIFYKTDTIFTWWAEFALVLLALYAIPALFGNWFMPRITLYMARKKKLKDEYFFTITEKEILRSSKAGELRVLWGDLISVDCFANNIFFNLKNGSMLIPVSRLSATELAKIKAYGQSINKLC